MLYSDNLLVGYSSSRKWFINAYFEFGNTYLVTGPNAAGKSTFFKGLSGLLNIYSGTCKIDGSPINFKSVEQLRTIFLCVLQQPQWLFLEKNFMQHIKKIELFYRTSLLKKLINFLDEDKRFNEIVTMEFHELPLKYFYILALIEDILYPRKVLLLDECPVFDDTHCNIFFDECLNQRKKKNLITLISRHDKDSDNLCNKCILLNISDCIQERKHD
jgi:ABC-type multidrug transport system ATPase subunit